MLNALLETFSCVHSETMLTIISFFQKLIKGGWNKSGGLENFSKINKRGGDDYSVLESICLKINVLKLLREVKRPWPIVRFE